MLLPRAGAPARAQAWEGWEGCVRVRGWSARARGRAFVKVCTCEYFHLHIRIFLRAPLIPDLVAPNSASSSLGGRQPQTLGKQERRAQPAGSEHCLIFFMPRTNSTQANDGAAAWYFTKWVCALGPGCQSPQARAVRRLGARRALLAPQGATEGGDAMSIQTVTLKQT